MDASNSKETALTKASTCGGDPASVRFFVKVRASIKHTSPDCHNIRVSNPTLQVFLCEDCYLLSDATHFTHTSENHTHGDPPLPLMDVRNKKTEPLHCKTSPKAVLPNSQGNEDSTLQSIGAESSETHRHLLQHLNRCTYPTTKLDT